MLKIRLKLTGRKKRPCYKIVLMESLSRRNGKAITELGYYDPLTQQVFFQRKKLVNSINNGAYPTDTVRHLISKILKNCFEVKTQNNLN
jgi:small subunit ribosomal protein S16